MHHLWRQRRRCSGAPDMIRSGKPKTAYQNPAQQLGSPGTRAHANLAAIKRRSLAVAVAAAVAGTEEIVIIMIIVMHCSRRRRRRHQATPFPADSFRAHATLMMWHELTAFCIPTRQCQCEWTRYFPFQRAGTAGPQKRSAVLPVRSGQRTCVCVHNANAK